MSFSRSFGTVGPLAICASLSALGLGLAAPSAHAAISVGFSFESQSPFPAGTIKGTVDGLAPDGDGNVFCTDAASCSGITATVTAAPDNAVLGTYPFLSAGSDSPSPPPNLAFKLLNGVITFANANFGQSGTTGVDRLTLGGFVSGPNFNYTELWGGNTSLQYRTTERATFSPVTTPAPGPLPLLGSAVALGWSRRLRSRIRP